MKTASILLAILLFAGARLASAQNLFVNPGFETGDFTGYTVTPAATNSLIAVQQGFGHTGTYEAQFAGYTEGSYDTISQTLNTAGILTLDVSFYVLPIGDPDRPDTIINGFQVTVGGQNYFSLMNTRADDYALYSFQVPTTGNTTTVSFGGYNVYSYTFLDDISVTAAVAPEPSTWATLGFGMVGAGLVTLCRRQRTA